MENKVETFRKQLGLSQEEFAKAIRGKTAQYVYALSLCVTAAAIVLFAVLDALGVIQSGKLLILYLGFYMVLQILSGQIIFRHLLKKY